jgi:hypothetical protein
MRWLLFGSFALLLGIVLPATAQPPAPGMVDVPPAVYSVSLPSATPPASEPPALPAPVLAEAQRAHEEQLGAFTLSADYLLLRAHSRPLDYAIVGPTNAFGPQGDVQSLSWNTTSGFRAGGSYRLPGECWEVGGYYTYFHTNANSIAAAGAGNTLFPTLTHPGMVEVAATAAAGGKIDYNIGDVEISKHFELGEALHVRAFAGPRYANIGYEINALYDGRDARNDRVRSRIDFDGAGARVGAEATWSLFHGLGVYARGGASLLAGSFRSSLTETTNNGVTPIVNVTDRFHKVVPVLEMGLGVNWKYRHFRVSAGYELVNWFGVIDGPDFPDDSHMGKLSHRVGDLGLEGLVLRAEWEF